MRAMRRVVRVEGPDRIYRTSMAGERFLSLSDPIIHLDCGHHYTGSARFTYPIGDWTSCSDCPAISTAVPYSPETTR